MVVVGASAFAAHRWWRSAPESTAEQAASAVVHSPGDPLTELQKSIAELSAHYEKDKKSKLPGTVSGSLPAIEKIDAALEIIRQQEGESTTKLIAQATLGQLQAYFFAAKLSPETYGEKFNTLANQLIDQSPASSAAAQAFILQFVSQLDFSTTIDASQLEALRVRAAACPDVMRGSALYSLVAHEFWSRGHESSAKAVLKAGSEQFKGTPGWRPLFDQMVAQGHLAPPKPSMKLGAFKNGAFDGRGCPRESDTVCSTSFAEDIAAEQKRINKELTESMDDLRRDLKKDGWTHLEFKKKGKKPVVFIK
jgi:hypothetical protein